MHNEYKYVIHSCKEMLDADDRNRWNLGEDAGYLSMKEFWLLSKGGGIDDERVLVTGKMRCKYF